LTPFSFLLRHFVFAVGGLPAPLRTCFAVFTKVDQPGLLDVLDRILDKGIVIDAWIRFSLVGLDLLTVEARIVVASIETYLDYANTLQKTTTLSTPRRQSTVNRKLTLVPARARTPVP